MRCLSPSPTAEIFRRTSLFFKNVDKLKQLALSGPHAEEEDGLLGVEIEKNAFSHAGLVLRSLTEFNVRSMCGEVVYGAGLQNYTQGRVSDKKFSKNTLSGKLNEGGRKWLSSRDPQFFEPTITLERNSKRPHICGGCACSLAGEGSLCTHMAALMVAWVRKPQDFAEVGEDQMRKSKFEDARQRVVDSLRELIGCIEKSSSRIDDLRVLQKTYSKLKLWADDVKEVNDGGLTIHAEEPDKDLRLFIREFSETLNCVSFALMSTIERKYKVGTTDLYNMTTVSTFARMLELFVESEGHRKLVDSILVRGTSGRKKETLTSPATVSSHTARSWDSLVENFSGR
jgi:hypothetical protein